MGFVVEAKKRYPSGERRCPLFSFPLSLLYIFLFPFIFGGVNDDAAGCLTSIYSAPSSKSKCWKTDVPLA